MELRRRFLLWSAAIFIAVLLIVAGGMLLFWLQLNQVEQTALLRIIGHHTTLIVLTSFGSIAIIGILVNWLLVNYLIPFNQVIEETVLITTANPSHRISLKGGREVQRLSRIINEAAERMFAEEERVQQRIRDAGQRMEEERNRLASLISDLEEGIVVCGFEGQVMLYNRRANALLTGEGEKEKYIGLGRSVFTVVDRNLIAHALDEVNYRLENHKPARTVQFAMTAPENRLLRMRLVPILQNREFHGYILIIYDITQRAARENQREMVLRSLSEKGRAALATIRAAIETIRSYPDMEDEQREKFRAVIDEGSQDLTRHINELDTLTGIGNEERGAPEEMSGADLMELLKRRCAQSRTENVKVLPFRGNVWVQIESFSFVQMVVALIRHIQEEISPAQVECSVAQKDAFVTLDLAWSGEPVTPKQLDEWKEMHCDCGGMSIGAVLEHHHGDCWSKVRQSDGKGYLRILLPAQMIESSRRTGSHIDVESRPEFYDFDLFAGTAIPEEVENAPLRSLNYTVFDTETTGLNPADGDEIISIGAVRIVNMRMLREEVFDRLIDPKRSMSPEAIRITGIQPEMLQGQPAIEQVLPAFQKFVGETVLVAHNAAFDMKFLHKLRERSGIEFSNPVLDTLLLSAVAQPNQERHNLEAISERFGITIVGRHTALGDALVTGEALIKLILLLEQQGIRTFAEARAASQKTLYARISY